MSKAKGTPTVLVSQEHFAAVTAVSNRLGVTTSTVANLVIQSTIAAAKNCIGANVLELLKDQEKPKSTAVHDGIKLPISTHTKRLLTEASIYLQLSEEVIALWSVHEFLPKVERVEPLNRHTLPPAIYNRVARIERGEYGTTRDRD